MFYKQQLIVIFLVLQLILAILRMCRGRDVLPLVAMARRAGHKEIKISNRGSISARVSSCDSTNSVMLVNPTSGDLSTCTTMELLQSTTDLLQQLSDRCAALEGQVKALETTTAYTTFSGVETDTNYPYNDMTDEINPPHGRIDNTSLDNCKAVCADTLGCKGIGYHPSTRSCWIKSSMQNRTQETGMDSYHINPLTRFHTPPS